MTLAEIMIAAGACGDLGAAESLRPVGVCIDSRAIKPGEMFVCLPGANFDGHEFAEAAVKAGACAVLASRPLPDVSGSDVADKAPTLLVPDTLKALGKIAAAYRRQTDAIVIAVTGSAGKTTVKELLAGILGGVGKTIKNYKNYNNLLGVPLTMLGAEGDEAFWVVELGISLPGEMEQLGAMVRPDLAVIVNIGPAHLEGLGSLEGVAEAKTSLLRSLAEGGRAVVGRDYDLLLDKARGIAPGVVDFSAEDDGVFSCRYMGAGDDGLSRFRLRLPDGDLETTCEGGAFMAENIAAAAAAATLIGVSPQRILEGVAEFRPEEKRFNVKQRGGFTIIDDTYNANPASMARAVESAAHRAGDKPLVLVLGDMLELGDASEEEHRKLGRLIASFGPAVVFHHGQFGPALAKGLGNGNFPGEFTETTDPEHFMNTFNQLGIEAGTALFKGSRSAAMERFAAEFMQCIGKGASA